MMFLGKCAIAQICSFLQPEKNELKRLEETGYQSPLIRVRGSAKPNTFLVEEI